MELFERIVNRPVSDRSAWRFVLGEELSAEFWKRDLLFLETKMHVTSEEGDYARQLADNFHKLADSLCADSNIFDGRKYVTCKHAYDMLNDYERRARAIEHAGSAR